MSEGRSSAPEGRSQPWVLYALIAANVAMFGVELASGIDPISPDVQGMVDLGASYAPLTLGGEWWRLGSSMFLHFGIVHLAMNMLCLHQARAVERLFGRLGFLAIYLLAGLGGGIAVLLVSGNVVSAGASGAVFGVYGAFGAKLVLHRSQFAPDSWRNTMRRLGTFLGLNAVIGVSVSSISLSAHIGGLIVGVAVAAALLAGTRAAPRGRAFHPAVRAIALIAAGLALTAVAARVIEPTPDVLPVLRKLYTLEDTVPPAANAAMQRYRARELTPAEVVVLFDRDVIAPYQQLREELRATTDIPSRLRPLFAKLDELVDARLAAWNAFKVFAVEPDPARQAGLFDAYKHANDQVTHLVDAVTAELRRLEK
jgi:membrane associated rhomboid family serine protease